VLNALLGRICFAPETRLLTPDGDKAISEFRPGDKILSAPDGNPDAPVEVKVVEEVFQNDCHLLNLHVNGKVIRTTERHPFYVFGKGWLAAENLTPGDLLRSHDGQKVAVEDVVDNGDYSVVYNLSVSDYHTYFVGGRSWGFSTWAHNFCNGLHHYVPRFLGSLVPYKNNLLTFFNSVQHARIHLALNAFLRSRYPGMLASRVNPGWLIRRNYSPAQRLGALAEFYSEFQNGSHLPNFVTELLDTIRRGQFR
jgi:pretoxin HINT domain-containing protein